MSGEFRLNICTVSTTGCSVGTKAYTRVTCGTFRNESEVFSLEAKVTRVSQLCSDD